MSQSKSEHENKIKVALADDHILLRSALSRVINEYEDCVVIIEAANGRELISQIESGVTPDLIILDLNMPTMDGIETTEWLHTNRPTINILILTMNAAELTLIRLLRLGIKGFLIKNITSSELHFAIRSVIHSGFYFGPDSTKKVMELFRKNPDNKSDLEKIMLNELELTFLKLTCTELTYKEIALKMGLNPRAIDNLRENLFNKLSVKSRIGLAMYAIRQGLVSG